MQFQIKQREFNLAHRLHAALEIFRCEHFVEQRLGQGLACLEMACHRAQHVPFPAKVFHELAWQLDRVPLDAVDAGDAEVIDLR